MVIRRLLPGAGNFSVLEGSGTVTIPRPFSYAIVTEREHRSHNQKRSIWRTNPFRRDVSRRPGLVEESIISTWNNLPWLRRRNGEGHVGFAHLWCTLTARLTIVG